VLAISQVMFCYLFIAVKHFNQEVVELFVNTTLTMKEKV